MNDKNYEFITEAEWDLIVSRFRAPDNPSPWRELTNEFLLEKCETGKCVYHGEEDILCSSIRHDIKAGDTHKAFVFLEPIIKTREAVEDCECITKRVMNINYECKNQYEVKMEDNDYCPLCGKDLRNE